MAPSNFEKACRDRGVLESELELVEVTVSQHTSTKVDETDCELFLERSNQMFETLRDIHQRIMQTDPADPNTHTRLYQDYYKRITRLISFFRSLKKSFIPATTTTTGSTQPSLRLPKLELPKFTGKFEDWQSFEDLFSATVTKNKHISNSEKLSYLRSCVEGDAAQLIKAFSITDSNFREAWDLLQSRYNNKKEIVQSFIRRLIRQPQIKQENVSCLQQLLNTTDECLRSLRVMGRDTDHWDDIIVTVIADKLDPDSRAEWAKSHRGTDPPTYKDFEAFLVAHIRSLLARGVSSSVRLPQRQGLPSGSKTVQSHHSAQQKTSCAVCSESHPIFLCEKFKAMQPSERNKFVKSNQLCYNCLRPHKVAQCISNSTCRKCNQKHNTLLHLPSAEQGTSGQNSQVPSTISSFGCATKNTQVLLKTAKVFIKDKMGIDRPFRAFLDDGSQSSFINASCASALGLPRQRVNVDINGIMGENVTSSKYLVNIKVKSRVTSSEIQVPALELPRVTNDLPTFPFTPPKWSHINNLQLADPEYMEQGKIDILLGTDVMASVLLPGLIVNGDNAPLAQNTIFGWVLSGHAPSPPISTVMANVSLCDINQTLTKFWEIEQMPEMKHFTEEEAECEQHFADNHFREPSGRYVCKLPFNEKKSQIGESLPQAEVRFKLLERRLRRNPQMKAEYKKFMSEYQQLNHMEEVPPDQINNPLSYYLPHHCVIKEDSTTTKLRVVFDGSARTSSGVSLNDSLRVGPTVQDDLFSILVRFRTHPVAMKADVAKMYRQFRVPREDADYQRILWRDEENQPLKTFRLTTVTYGTASAPYLATRCLKQLSIDAKDNFPSAAEVISNDMYVDDLMTGSFSTKSATELYKQLTTAVQTAGMSMRKWATNDKKLLATIDPELRETTDLLKFDTDSTVKALGILWNPSEDVFLIKITSPLNKPPSKRIMLSELAKVFDPLGFYAPVTVNAKILFQELWKLNINWDDLPPNHIIEMWTNYQHNLPELEAVKIQRCIVIGEHDKCELHAFSDASEKAYAGAIYLRVTSPNNDIKVNLVAAKTKVAPIQQISLPRLELCGALLASELLQAVSKAIKLKCSLHAWSDSTIVLSWLNSYPGRWNTYVANRVAKIQEIIPLQQWNHVRSESNPADCASRGISAAELLNHHLWWHGPQWLSEPSYNPVTPVLPDIIEEKRINCHLAATAPLNPLFDRYSSLIRLKRIVALIMRFLHNCKGQDKRAGELTVDELNSSFRKLIQLTQQHSFGEEISILSNHESLKKGRLLQLNPFVDSYGLLRVGGRLQKSNISEDSKHPLILPHHHPLVKLLVWHIHLQNMHSGAQLTLATLQQQFWILRARDSVRYILRKCVNCKKQKAELAQQLMGSLPSSRVNPSRPFDECAVDYAGPFLLQLKSGRGQRPMKCYFSIFVCMATKAIHLECVHSLTTEDFIAAFKRFISRRGIPSKIQSDNGTTFVGASTELAELLTSASHNRSWAKELANCGTEFLFACPSAPHQNGLVEAGVKSVKFHLRRVIGKSTPTILEFETLLCMIEACVNSRPLCAIPSESSDPMVLTPGHFLVGGPLNAVPEPDMTATTTNRLSRWQQTQQMFQHFWRHWKGEYLTTMQQRFKWKTKRENLEVGDIVIIKEDCVPPLKWRLAKVIKVKMGPDSCVRNVTVKTATTELDRPIHNGMVGDGASPELTRPFGDVLRLAQD